MAFTQKEQQIIQWNKQNGKSTQEMREAILRFRETGSPKDTSKPPVETTSFVGRTGGELKQTFSGLQKTTERGAELMQEGKPVRGAVMAGLGAAGGFVRGAFSPVTAALAPLFQKGLEASGITENKVVQEKLASLDAWAKANPDAAENLKNAVEVVGVVPVVKGFKAGAEAVTSATGRGVTATKEGVARATEAITEAPVVGGAIQKGTELAERVPRFVGRVKESAKEASIRAEQLKTATPAVQEAIKVNLKPEIIDFAQTADNATLQGAKEMIELAPKSGKLGVKTNPLEVPGKVVADQYSVIEKQKRTVGKQIGEAVDKLSKKGAVSMDDSISILDDLLEINNGTLTSKGWTFKGGLTPQEAARVNELYKEVIKAKGGLTPRQIYDFDQVFSKLNREAKFDGLGNIIVKTSDGDSVNLFQAFRDVFRNKLDEVSPEDIRALNKEYRNLIIMLEDVDDSIIKGSKQFNITVDKEDLARNGLRRLQGEAQSSPIYREIAEQLDAQARALGYEGPDAIKLAAFAEELRTIYPETIPKTGFQGGIRRVTDIAQQVLKAGAPNEADQQRALKALIEELIK